MRGVGSGRRRQPFLDGHWLRSLGFTVGLVGLVAAVFQSAQKVESSLSMPVLEELDPSAFWIWVR